jgi:uncharacterized protein YcfJ
MEAIKTTTSRIHPLMAAAAVSVIVVSLAGAAAITGMLPSSHSAPDVSMTTAQANPAYVGALAPVAAPGVAAPVGAPQVVQAVPANYVQPGTYAQQAAYGQPTAYAQPTVAAAQPAPVVIKETVIKEVPVKQVVTKTRVVHHTAPAYYEPVPRPAAQPNYVAIGTGAVVGGLLGNQVGSGNGRKLATIAGVIGGGMLGNQIANQR